MTEEESYSSRLAFVVSRGVSGRNARMWSFVNDDEKFVIFGAWEHFKENSKHLILADSWITLNGRRQGGYTHSLRHIELILEEGYKLFIFYQTAYPRLDDTKPSKLKNFKAKLIPKELMIDGDEYFAVDLIENPELKVNAPQVTLNHQPEYWEGNQTTQLTTSYERNPDARAACLAKKGHSCEVCEFNFRETYGELGGDYIHVHHTVRVADRQGLYKVNPTEDLVPLCPNCHAMTHKRIPPYSTEELKAIIRETAS